MKRFRYRLEKLLQLRASTEQQQARALGDALQDEERDRRNLEEITAEHDRAQLQMENIGSGTPRAGVLVNVGRALRRFRSRQQAAGEVHQETLKRVGAERERFTEARKERRVLERLRDRKQAEWSAQYAKEEQASTDEVASRRNSRDGGERS